MAIPPEILAVERPKSTRVLYSFGRYLVIKRTSKRVGKKVVPVDLGTIGEIKDGKYIEIRKEPAKKKDGTKVIDIKDYGEVALCDSVGNELLDELKEVYDLKEAMQIYAIALLRAAYPDIKNRDIQMAYETSFVSEEYKKVPLSENTISTLLENLGKAYRYICQFMLNRVANLKGAHVVIDGMLKGSNGETDTFAEFSRKGKKKSSKDLSLIYAYDPLTQEPIAVKPYPGNMVDMTSMNDFINECGIKSGIIVADKGFYNPNSIAGIKKNRNLSYIVPLKQNSKKISDNEMNKDLSSLLEENKDENVFYKKKKTADDCFLYAFRNPKDAYNQETGYLVRNRKKDTYDEEKYLEKKDEFGLIVFESNADLDPLVVYNAYSKRWEIELMFNMYKNIIELDTTRVHGDYRIYATEFINLLSVIISCRVKKKLNETGISKKYSYKQVFNYLAKAKKVRVGSSNTWQDSTVVKYIAEMMEILGV